MPFFRPRAEQEIDEEIAHHLELQARELESRGVPPAEARERARQRFGDVDEIRRACRGIARGRERDMRIREALHDLGHDLRHAARQMRRAPGFTLVAAGTLALGIGAATAVFAALHAVVLRPLPYPEPQRLVAMETTWPGGRGAVSVGNFLDIQRHAKSFEALAPMRWSSVNLQETGAPERLYAARVGHEYFTVTQVAPLLGGVFGREHDQPGRGQVVVLSHRLWQRRFGSDAQVAGREIRLDGQPHTGGIL